MAAWRRPRSTFGAPWNSTRSSFEANHNFARHRFSQGQDGGSGHVLLPGHRGGSDCLRPLLDLRLGSRGARPDNRSGTTSAASSGQSAEAPVALPRRPARDLPRSGRSCPPGPEERGSGVGRAGGGAGSAGCRRALQPGLRGVPCAAMWRGDCDTSNRRSHTVTRTSAGSRTTPIWRLCGRIRGSGRWWRG